MDVQHGATFPASFRRHLMEGVSPQPKRDAARQVGYADRGLPGFVRSQWGHGFAWIVFEIAVVWLTDPDHTTDSLARRHHLLFEEDHLPTRPRRGWELDFLITKDTGKSAAGNHPVVQDR